jgi:hypothetical protein
MNSKEKKSPQGNQHENCHKCDKVRHKSTSCLAQPTIIEEQHAILTNHVTERKKLDTKEESTEVMDKEVSSTGKCPFCDKVHY